MILREVQLKGRTLRVNRELLRDVAAWEFDEAGFLFSEGLDDLGLLLYLHPGFEVIQRIRSDAIQINCLLHFTDFLANCVILPSEIDERISVQESACRETNSLGTHLIRLKLIHDSIQIQDCSRRNHLQRPSTEMG